MKRCSRPPKLQIPEVDMVVRPIQRFEISQTWHYCPHSAYNPYATKLSCPPKCPLVCVPGLIWSNRKKPNKHRAPPASITTQRAQKHQPQSRDAPSTRPIFHVARQHHFHNRHRRRRPKSPRPSLQHRSSSHHGPQLPCITNQQRPGPERDQLQRSASYFGNKAFSNDDCVAI